MKKPLALPSLAVAVLMLSPPAVRGETAHLVIDAEDRATTHPLPVGPGPLFAVGEKILFSASTRTTGNGLWTTDGTPAGTEMLSDPTPGASFDGQEVLGTARGLLFWRQDRGQLWRSDGTRAGTFELPAPPASQEVFLGDILYFFGCSDEGLGCALWRTDGTVAGTRSVEGYAEGSLSLLAAAGNRLFFSDFKHTSREDLLTSDGRAGGPRLLSSALSSIDMPVAAGDRLFFIGKTEGASWETEEELWVSDGTEAGTRPVTAFENRRPFEKAEWLAVAGSRVYFLADDVTHGVEIWRSDGTVAGTKRITEFGFHNPFSDPKFGGPLEADELIEVGDRLVFLASDGIDGYRLWSTRGTPESTVLLHDPCGGGFCGRRPELVRVGGRVLFRGDDQAHGGELWSTDGTPAGTALVKDVCPGSCDGVDLDLIPYAGRAAFLSGRSTTSTELWTTDGTAVGTRRLAQIPEPVSRLFGVVSGAGGGIVFSTGSHQSEDLWVVDRDTGNALPLVASDALASPTSRPTELMAAGGRIYFATCHDVPGSSRRRMWSSAGTPATTHELTELIPWDCGGGGKPVYIGSANGMAFLIATDTGLGEQLWRSNGLPGGTLQLTSFPYSTHRFGGDAPPTAEFQGKLVFPVVEGDAYEIWTSDGTPQGTRKLFTLPDNEPPNIIAGLGPHLYILTGHGDEKSLWRSDGTTAGTRQLATGIPPAERIPEPEFVRAGALVLFQAGDWLWKTDGTAAGTGPLSPPRTFEEPPVPDGLVAHQGAVYFISGDGRFRSDTRILWRTDGTSAGTVVVAEFPSPLFLFQQTPVSLGVRLVFVVSPDEGHSSQLWASDGTAAGTAPFYDIEPRGEMAAAGGLAYFAAGEPVHGEELWVTDGTAAGTRMVQDLAPGSASSSPEELTVAGGHLFFTADDGVTGREVWALPLAGGVCQPSATTLCVGGNRFQVEAVWRDFQGRRGLGQAVALTGDTGYFWFFGPENVEVVLKVLDGRGLNDHFWVFYGALSSVSYVLTVRDTHTGLSRRYYNPGGQLASVGDTNGFGRLGAFSSAGPRVAAPSPRSRVTERTAAATGACVPAAGRLCLNGGRFAVETRWKDFAGRTGSGTGVGLTGDTGYFWFFGPENVEVMIKVLDGQALNGKFWVFFGALSNVEYTVTVTDTLTGKVKTYSNPGGRFASVGDTNAF